MERLKKRNGFTRLELTLVMAMLFLLLAVALSRAASTQYRSRLAQCFNNLRQVGHGFHGFAMSVDDRLPWQFVPPEGGVGNPAANAFYNFAVASNYFGTPAILICPSDVAKKAAKDFTANPGGGFSHISFQNNALSYIVAFHARLDMPRQILSGDRHMRVSRFRICRVVNLPAGSIDSRDPSAGWTNLHSATGNLLFTDGSVQTTTSAGLRVAADRSSGDGYDAAYPSTRPADFLIPGVPATVPE